MIPSREEWLAYQAMQRASFRRRQARKRERWAAAGRCYECGGARDGASRRCGLCRVGNMIRVDRSRFQARERLRMAKASLVR
jgi:hypothetical protein